MNYFCFRQKSILYLFKRSAATWNLQQLLWMSLCYIFGGGNTDVLYWHFDPHDHCCIALSFTIHSFGIERNCIIYISSDYRNNIGDYCSAQIVCVHQSKGNTAATCILPQWVEKWGPTQTAWEWSDGYTCAYFGIGVKAVPSWQTVTMFKKFFNFVQFWDLWHLKANSKNQ